MSDDDFQKLAITVARQSLALLIAEARIQALTDELAAALTRQGIDPSSFLTRLNDRAGAAARKALLGQSEPADDDREPPLPPRS